ncbi:MAG: hypothetical protein QM701_12985 [Propionivibrio sp.]
MPSSSMRTPTRPSPAAASRRLGIGGDSTTCRPARAVSSTSGSTIRPQRRMACASASSAAGDCGSEKATSKPMAAGRAAHSASIRAAWISRDQGQRPRRPRLSSSTVISTISSATGRRDTSCPRSKTR